jgi:hypothetical protein
MRFVRDMVVAAAAAAAAAGFVGGAELVRERSAGSSG